MLQTFYNWENGANSETASLYKSGLLLMKTFQAILLSLQNYWTNHGCHLLQPHDSEVGAGTFHQGTFFKALGPEPWSACYVQPSRRPTDGRYAQNPNRLQHYYQFQTVLKPTPDNLQQIYLNSLSEIGLNATEHDVRFVEDDWKSPTLGAWGLGWEVWLDGMEISQITYFQEVAGIKCRPVLAEITYGLERLAMYLQEENNVFNLIWNDKNSNGMLTYGDIWQDNEYQQSVYNFEKASISSLFDQFKKLEEEAHLIMEHLPIPGYEITLKCSHLFNILDARQAISNVERVEFIRRIRNMSKEAAQSYLKQREQKGFPLLKKAQGIH